MLFLLIIVFYILTDHTIAGFKCSSPFEKVGNQCLYFDALIVETYENARTVCHNLGGHSARITEPQQLKDIVDFIKENDSCQGVSYWLDADELENEGHFVYSNGVDVPMGTPYWDVYYHEGVWNQEPYDPNPSYPEKCLILYKTVSLYFNDDPCTNTHSVLCEEQYDILVENKTAIQDISCPPLFIPVSGMCLAFMTYVVEQTWAEARLACTSLGGQLAKITEPQQLRDIYIFINDQGFSEDSFWIDGSDQETEGVWLYTDRSPVPRGTPFWGNNADQIQEPDGGTSENCLTLLAPGYYYFRDVKCGNLYSPLCSADPLQ